MATSTRWRITGVETYSASTLELSSLQLLNSSVVIDADATFDCNQTPISGAVSNLRDADLSTVSKFRASGSVLVFTWTFASAVEATSFRVGSGGSKANFLARADAQYFDTASGLWVQVNNVGDVPFPGANQLTSDLPLMDAYAVYLQRLVPTAWYRLDEKSGTVCADSAVGGLYPCTYSGDAAGFTAASLINESNASIKITGTTNARRGVSRASAPVSTSAAWSVMLLAQPTGVAPHADKLGTLFRLAGAGSAELNIVDVGSGKFQVRLMNSGYLLLGLSSATWTYGTRLHICIAYTPGTIRCYINGVLDFSASVSFANLSAEFSIGFANFGNINYYPHEGFIDEVSVFSRELLAAEIAQSFKSIEVNATAYSSRRVRSKAAQTNTAASSPLAAHTMQRAGLCTARDTEFGGQGCYPFVVEGLPTSQKARVSLLRARDRLVAREMWSAADGTGEFTGLDVNTQFIAVAQDPSGLMHPVGAAHYPILPESTT